MLPLHFGLLVLIGGTPPHTPSPHTHKQQQNTKEKRPLSPNLIPPEQQCKYFGQNCGGVFLSIARFLLHLRAATVHILIILLLISDVHNLCYKLSVAEKKEKKFNMEEVTKSVTLYRPGET